MDSAEIFVTLGGAALIAWTLWFFFGQRENGKSPATQSKSTPYTCPMHPWIVSRDPAATCSICGMKLTRESGTAST
jgi:hypothetical protein